MYLSRSISLVIIYNLLVFVCSINVPESPCPEVFLYSKDENNNLLGYVSIIPEKHGQVNLTINVSIGKEVDKDFKSNLRIEQSESLIKESVRNGEAIYYKFNFPYWKDVQQKITEVAVNGKTLCTDSPVEKYTLRTDLTLRHSLRIETKIVTVLKPAGDAPVIETPASNDTTHLSFNNHNNYNGNYDYQYGRNNYNRRNNYPYYSGEASSSSDGYNYYNRPKTYPYFSGETYSSPDNNNYSSRKSNPYSSGETYPSSDNYNYNSAKYNPYSSGESYPSSDNYNYNSRKYNPYSSGETYSSSDNYNYNSYKNYPYSSGESTSSSERYIYNYIDNNSYDDKRRDPYSRRSYDIYIPLENTKESNNYYPNNPFLNNGATTSRNPYTIQYRPTPRNTYPTPTRPSSSNPYPSNPFLNNFGGGSAQNQPYQPPNTSYQPPATSNGWNPPSPNTNTAPLDPKSVYASNPFLNPTVNKPLSSGTFSIDRNPPRTKTTTDHTIIFDYQDSSPWNTNGQNTNQNAVQQSVNAICGASFSTNTANRIWNGQRVEKGEYPWLAAMFVKQDSDMEFACGASLVSHKHVITAAHCIRTENGLLQPNQIHIALGRHNVMNEKEGMLVGCSALNIHPNYRHGTADADIAVIALNTYIDFTEMIKPVCLYPGPPSPRTIVGRYGVVVGWGRDQNGNMPTKEAQQIEMPVVSLDECRKSNDKFKGVTSAHTFCAGLRNNSGPCSGDSGGGFVSLENDRWILRGIVSIAISRVEDGVCDLREYVVFTDAVSYVNWLYKYLGI